MEGINSIQLLFDWVANRMLEFIFSLQIALGYLISKIGKVREGCYW